MASGQPLKIIQRLMAHPVLECKVLGCNTDNQWACLGPGAKNGLRRIFCLETTRGELRLTRLLRDLCHSKGSKSGFEKLNLAFPLFLLKELSLKNVEHALCEYDKYCRFALGQPTRDRTYQTRGQLDKQSQCRVCSNANCDKDNSQKCLLCNSVFHKHCEKKWKEMFYSDGSWLCTVCHKIETAWTAEEFDFEEEDLSERPTREKKAAASRRCQDRKQGKTTKKSFELSTGGLSMPQPNTCDFNNNSSLPSKYHCIILIKRDHCYST